MIENGSIVYLRARVCGQSEDIGGQPVVVLEPVDRTGRAIPDSWLYTMPIEYLIPIEEMRRIKCRSS
jgi:hypothetical protein